MTWPANLGSFSWIREPIQTQKAAHGGLCVSLAGKSALARLEARIALANDENLATATHDLAIAMTGLGGFERRQDFHDETIGYGVGKPRIVTDCSGKRNSGFVTPTKNMPQG